MNLCHLIKFSLNRCFTIDYVHTKITSGFISVRSITFVSHCFQLHVFYFEKFATWIWRLKFAIDTTLRPRPQESQYARWNRKPYTWYLRMRQHKSSLESLVQTNTLLRSTFGNYLLVGVRKPSLRCDFAIFLIFLVAIFFSKMARPPCALSHQALVHSGQTQYLLWRFRRSRFTRLRLVL